MKDAEGGSCMLEEFSPCRENTVSTFLLSSFRFLYLLLHISAVTFLFSYSFYCVQLVWQ